MKVVELGGHVTVSTFAISSKLDIRFNSTIVA